MAQPGRPPARPGADAGRAGALPRHRSAARHGVPPGGDQRHGRGRRRPGVDDQCRAADDAVELVRGAPGAAGIRLLRRDLRRRHRRVRGRHGRPAHAAADEPVWLEQARLRPAGGQDAARRGGAAAAMGRAEVLQRLRPERVPQGLHGLGGEGQARRRAGRARAEAVPLHPAGRGGRPADARLHLGGRRGGRDALAARIARRERPVQRRHRQRPLLPALGGGGVPRRPGAGADGVHRHAGAPARAATSPSPRPARSGCAARATPASSPCWRKACGATSTATSRWRTATVDPRPAVPAVRPGAGAARAAVHPLVCAGLYRQPAARLAHHAAAGAAQPRGGHGGADRRLPDLGDARRRARRPAGLRAVLPAEPLPGGARIDLRGVGGRHVVPRRRARRGGGAGAVLLAQPHPAAGLRRPHRRGDADRARARPGRQLHQRRAVGPPGARLAALGDDLPPRRRRSRATRARSTRR